MNRFAEYRAFVAVAAAGVNGAARRLNLAPSAVSRRVRDLERDLGLQLFSRTGRTLVLTDAGRAYLAEVESILDRVQDADRRVRDRVLALSGRVRLAAPLSFGLSDLVPILADWQAEHPGIELEIDLNDRPVDIARDGFDLAIRIGALADSSLKARKLTRYPFVLACAPGYFAEGEVPTRIADLEDLPGLLYDGVAEPRIWRGRGPDGTEASATLRPRMVSNNGEALREAAIRGLGLTLQPAFLLAPSVRAGALEAILPDHDWGGVDVHALRPPRRYQPERVTALIEHLTRALRAAG